MMTEIESQQCYNRGCGKKYNPADNGQDSCTYHPGAPFFHDAYKGWSCCKKKTVDFTEFLNTKGCTRGFHSNVKPPEPEKPVKESSPASEQIFSPQVPNNKLQAPAPRPDFNTPMVELPCTVAASLKQALERHAATASAAPPATPDAGTSTQVQPGTPCQHRGCQQVYGSCDSDCIHHPGVPVFHEGMKYWSCCQRKTSDFNTFLSQPGCTTGDHLWVKRKEGEARRAACRYDWHQTGSHVTVAIYAKLARPERCRVEASAVRLRPHVVFADDQLFQLDLELGGLVDPAASKVSLMGTKVEIVLKKAEPRSWNQLSLPRAAPTPAAGDQPPAAAAAAAAAARQPAPDAVAQRVEAVDLSDL